MKGKKRKTNTIVKSLRQSSLDIEVSDVKEFVVPDTDYNGKGQPIDDAGKVLKKGESGYPMNIKAGTYTKKELARAIYFLADLMEE